MIRSWLYSFFKFADLFIMVYFLFFVQPRLFGWLVAVLVGYRVLKTYLPGGTYTLRLLDCTYHHRKDDGHRHVGPGVRNLK